MTDVNNNKKKNEQKKITTWTWKKEHNAVVLPTRNNYIASFSSYKTAVAAAALANDRARLVCVGVVEL